MQVATIKEITLESTSVTGSTYDEYSSNTSYSADDTVKVSFASDGVTALFPVVEYVSLDNANLDNYPPDNPLKWSEVGTANHHKMFDDYLNTLTEDTADIEVAVESNGSDMVGLFRVKGSAVTFELWRNDSMLETETVQLRFSPSAGWYSWLYDAFEYKTKAFWEYTKYPDATVKVTLSTAESVAECGGMTIGAKVALGITKYDASVGITDYSVISEDVLGRLYLAQGNYADRAEVDLWLSNTEVDKVKLRLADLRGTLAMWDLNNNGSDYDSLRIYGRYKNFDIIISGPVRSKCSIEIGGTT